KLRAPWHATCTSAVRVIPGAGVVSSWFCAKRRNVMLVTIRRCPTCPLLRAHAAALAWALKSRPGFATLLLDGAPSEFRVYVDGEPLADRKEGLPSIHELLNALGKRASRNGKLTASGKAMARARRAALPSCRLPGVYHYAGRECVAGINLLPPAWFQTRLV